MSDYVSSSPYFFRLIKRAILSVLLVLLLGVIFLPAPLLPPADLAEPPNPAKAAWFLIWVQELLSYSNRTIYLVIAAAGAFVLLPYWAGRKPLSQARWFPAGQLAATLFTLSCALILVALTLVAWLFRGINWSFVW